jgi:signal transduction histidine kinase
VRGGHQRNEPGTREPDETTGPGQVNTLPGDGADSAGREMLRILILEDEASDAELAQRLLTRTGLCFTAVVVDTRASFVQQLTAFRPEVILSDFSLPGFSGESALKIAQEQCPHIPFIFLSSVLGDEAAVELIRQGATDYVLKDRLARLPSVIRRAIAEAGQRAQLAQLEAQLQQSQRLENLGQLAGGVAHDFNNLLGVILNYASFVSEELAAPPGSDWPTRLESVRSDIGQITQAAERAAILTRQLLAFARRKVIRPQVLDLDNVITGVEEMLRRTLGAHVELVTTLGGGLWPVLADLGQLEQVLMNLVVNARDAMPNGGTLNIDTSNITVDADTIAGGSKARPGRNVRLRVSDTGTGMTPDVIERVFEPFFTTKDEGSGTGLGLATVYGIITQAEGRIQIYSEHGTGTTFSIMLPVTAVAAAPAAEPVPYKRTPKGETVLVVEDEEALREVTKRIFTRNGYHVITAANGPEALAIARGHPGEIHLLITDVVMPHMLGNEVAAKMRTIKPGIEVLFMSGYARPVLASQGMLDPKVGLVEKPFSEADLLKQAGQVLNGHFLGFKTIKGSPD